MKSWIEVSEERLKGNFRVVAEEAGGETQVLAVVKANAYGHGAEKCAVALARAGAKWLGVADVREGARVRAALDAAGFSAAGPSTALPSVASLRMTESVGGVPEILVMCGLMPEDVKSAVEHRLTPVVWTAEQVEWLGGNAALRMHVEVDTGMGRQGVRPGSELDRLLHAVQAEGPTVDGVMTHFCAAEVAGGEMTQQQQRRFESACLQVRAKGLRPRWVHAGSSSSVDNPAQERRWLVELGKSMGAQAMVRIGIALYGYCLPLDGVGASSRLRGKLKPVMTWKTRVIDVRQVGVGESIGYNATYTATGPMRLALLPVGYSDGLRRELGSTNARPGGWVMIGGRDGEYKRAAIVGRVSMNLTMVDVSGIEGVGVGDEVVLLGDGVTADDHAQVAGTISYEMLCGVRAGT